MLMMAGAGLLDGCCSIDDIRVAEVIMIAGRLLQNEPMIAGRGGCCVDDGGRKGEIQLLMMMRDQSTDDGGRDYCGLNDGHGGQDRRSRSCSEYAFTQCGRRIAVMSGALRFVIAIFVCFGIVILLCQPTRTPGKVSSHLFEFHTWLRSLLFI